MSMRVTAGGAWPGWLRGMRSFRVDGGLQEWENVTEEFFDATQEVVHVITGQLRSSGKASVEADGASFVGTVEYTAPYAAEEFGRGGPHDAIQRGYENVMERFPEAVQRTLAAALEGAFR